MDSYKAATKPEKKEAWAKNTTLLTNLKWIEANVKLTLMGCGIYYYI